MLVELHRRTPTKISPNLGRSDPMYIVEGRKAASRVHRPKQSAINSDHFALSPAKSMVLLLNHGDELHLPGSVSSRVFNFAFNHTH